MLWVIILLCLSGVSHALERCDGTEYYVVPNGRDYRGVVNTTASGLVCQKWSSQTPHQHDTLYPNPSLGIADNNYCRNPFDDSTVGCFTMDPDVRYEACDIGPPCATSAPPPTRVVTFSIANSSTVAFGTFVCVTCSDTCDIVYTLDGTEPARTSGQLMQHCIALQSSTVTLNVAAYYMDGSVLRQKRIFYVTPPQYSGSFYPEPTLYLRPILLFVKLNGTILAASLFFDNATIPTPLSVDGMWISTARHITAVYAGEVIASGYFDFSIPSPEPPTVFPENGTFLGGVKLLVYPLNRASSMTVSINGSTPELLTSSIIPIHVVGLTSVAVYVTYVDGTSASSQYSYRIVEASSATCSPAPDTYTTAITITCLTPQGVVAWLNATNESYTTTTLALPGTYHFQVSYLDDSNTLVTKDVQYTLQTTPLDAPNVSPCGGSFPYLAAHLQIVYGQGNLIATSSESVTVRSIDSTGVVVTAAAPSTGVVSFLLTPVDSPLKANSSATACTVEFLGSGSCASTTYRVLAPVNSTAVAHCLSFVTITPLVVHTIGIYDLVSIADLPCALTGNYSDRLYSCLLLQGTVTQTFSAVTSYRISTETATVGTEVVLGLEGYNLASSSVKMVDTRMTCADVGVTLRVNALTNTTTFLPPTPGTYRLCASSNGQEYNVVGNTITVVSRMRLPTVAPCGGLVSSAAPVPVVINANDGTQISVNGGTWQSVAQWNVTSNILPLHITAINEYNVLTCIFYSNGSQPQNVNYNLQLFQSGIELSLSGVFDVVVPVSIALHQSNCTSLPGTLLGATAINTSFVIADSLVTDALLIPPDVVVCLHSGSWVTPVKAATFVLSKGLMDIVSCTSCSSSMCFKSNGTCACWNDGLLLGCNSSDMEDTTASAPLWLQATMLVIYAVALSSLWIVYMCRNTGKRQ